jgi:RimJ/RimL family protein N-acetyltransferase
MFEKCFFPLIFAAALLAAAPGCQSPASSSQADAWSPRFTPPRSLDTGRVHLEPLTPDHAPLDHAAFMSSRDHLRRTLHWGSWPKDEATVEDNRKDLERHRREFEERKAYAYTVLSPNRQECLGCVYMEPVKGRPRDVDLAFWVVEPEVRTGLDEHLLKAVLDWIRRDWPFDVVVVSFHVDNTRGIEIAEQLHLPRGQPSDAEHVTFLWQRSASSIR